MFERRVPGLTIEQIRSNVVKPGGIPEDRWETGLAVTEHLMHEGIPVDVLSMSAVGPDIPIKYYMTGTGVIVRHMPHWQYAIVDNGSERTHVSFIPDPTADAPDGNDYLSREDVLVNLKDAVVKAWR